MSDLGGQVLLQESKDLRGINFRNRLNGNFISREQMLMRVAHGSERGCGPEALNMGVRQKFERVGERIVPSGKDLTIGGPRHQARIVESDIALIDQAKGSLGLVAGTVKEA